MERMSGSNPPNPIQPGEVRNPKGVNQYTYREDAERDLAEWCKIYGSDLIEKLCDEAKRGNDKMMKLALDRILPAVTKHEVAVPGADPAGLAAFMASLTPDRRANGHDRTDEHPGTNGSGGVDS